MVAPLLVFILALALYPTVLTTIDAFMHIDALTPPNHFAGFGNFTAIFSNPEIRQSFENTGWYVLFGVMLTLVLGTAFGLCSSGASEAGASYWRSSSSPGRCPEWWKV